MRLDLASGQRCQPGFVGVDIAADATNGPDRMRVDLFAFPWPILSDSVEEVWCSHFVEHTPDLIAFMQELWRILKPDARATIIAPYYTSMRAFQDPTHTRMITDATFLYFDARWRERERLHHYPITCDFELVQVQHAIHPDWTAKPMPEILAAMKTQWNVIEDIQVVLRKR